MDRRTLLHSGLALVPGSSLLAALEQGKLDEAAGVLAESTATGQVRASALYVRQGEREFVRSFGDAAESVDSIFLLASISKPISIAGVMTLHDRGEFGLDDPVTKFIPEFRGEGRETITMRQLMTHVSGLPDQLPQNRDLRSSHAPLSAFVDAAIRTPLLFAPGTQYSYSSMAILLATEVARRITGMPIARLVDEAVYRPLGLKHSAMGIASFPLESVVMNQVETAAPESGAGDPTTKTWDWNSRYWREMGAPWGAAHGSAPDVGRFLRAFLHPDGRMMKEETARLMVTNHNPEGIRPRGLGFDLGGVAGSPGNPTTFGHTGSTGTLCWADPPSDSICVVLTTLPAKVSDREHPRYRASRRVVAGIS